MKIFVASWFFPPATSSEGIVTFKLLSHSKHTYDVCSADSDLWSYGHKLNLTAENINVFPIKTNDIDEWIDGCVKLFLERNKTENYDAIMTRSMPPESIEVAKKIKEAAPDAKWIASIADPIAKSPYDIKALILDNKNITERDKADFQVALYAGCDGWSEHPSAEIQQMCKSKEVEDYAIHNADALIFPLDTLKNYVLAGRRRKNAFSVPHSFDKEFYPTPASVEKQDGVTELTFLGHSDGLRSLEPLVRAMKVLRDKDEEAIKHLKLRFIGNVPDEVRTLIYNYYLFDNIAVEDSVDYLTSLKIMQETDWLIHIDAAFGFLEQPGDTVFFAGKIADYFGTDKPILAITGDYSPAYSMIKDAGGTCCESKEINELSEILRKIADGSLKPEINRSYRDKFASAEVAKAYDAKLENAVHPTSEFSRTAWPEVKGEDAKSKFLSICVPSYNVEQYLDRCLLSLVSSDVANKLEVIVVNDGSHDNTINIAKAYQEHYPSIIKIVDKENGGHGSTINAALEVATGTYFRVIDGDDWVDSRNLSEMITNLEKMDRPADLVSTNYHQVYVNDGHTVAWTKIGSLENYKEYSFKKTDFSQEYFTMASSMFKTEILKKAKFKLQEHTFYVDVEYILFPIPFVNTVVFTPEYVYKYAVGNADQSINRDVFVKRYDHHDRVIRRMVKYFHDHKRKMNANQVGYMKTRIVYNLLNSHFTLSLLWDANKEEGLERAKDFDKFLGKTDKEIYEAIGNEYPLIHDMRESDYAESAFGVVGSLYDSISALQQKEKIHEIGSKGIMKIVPRNRITRKIANTIVKK
ncbi:MAG: glycosyltransferase [Phoenicibacter congonensis]|uniref:Glycosyltransferase n=1 Tax=Phoenicibacter congonensis TaxID=1944646 RepID=A0AA43RII0_9ACTN|nr:glycosyltransferase [Phoenicibacter congonensis]